MGDYIPDLTERFPEGFGGIDLTDSFFPPSHYDSKYDWDLMERAKQMDMEDEIPYEEPRQFEVGNEYTQVGIYGGATTYIVREIDRENNRIKFGEIWYDVDGTGTRPPKWHKLETDSNGNERALNWTSDKFGDIWIEA